MITTIALILAANAIRPGGDMRDVSMVPPAGVAASVTLDAMPYTRTVTCGSYTLTGTFTGATPTWSASPSGASGSCSDTGGGTFSCVVDVDPDATGEGVETITVTNGATDTETIGFYVDGEHSCFLSQSVDGSYNSTLANLDAVTTWENLGSSALDVTQPGAATLKPTYRTGIVGGQPVVRCDGGDRVAASTASDWDFLSDLSDSSIDLVSQYPADTNTYGFVVASGNGTIGAFVGCDYRSAVTQQVYGNGPTARAVRTNSSIGVFTYISSVFDDTAGIDMSIFENGVAGVQYTGATSSLAASPLVLCGAASTFPFTGDLFRVLIYQSALTSTQRGINKAVDEWALGGTLPVTP